MNLTRIWVVFFCFTVFCSMNAFADQSEALEMQAEFQKIDANNDGSIIPEEMQAYQARRFKELDSDKNGLIDAREMKADKTGMFKNADKNKDKIITQQESSLTFKEYFDAMDSNGDAFVSEKEFKDYNPVVIKF